MKNLRMLSPKEALLFIAALTFFQLLSSFATVAMTGAFDPARFALNFFGSVIYFSCFFLLAARFIIWRSVSTKPYSDKSTGGMGWLFILLAFTFSDGFGPTMPLWDYFVLLMVLVSGVVLTVTVFWRYRAPIENTIIVSNGAVFYEGEKIDAFFPATNKTLYRMDEKCLREFPNVNLRFADGRGIMSLPVSVEINFGNMKGDGVRQLDPIQFTISVNDIALQKIRELFRTQPISYAQDPLSWNRRLGFAEVSGVFVEFKWPRVETFNGGSGPIRFAPA